MSALVAGNSAGRWYSSVLKSSACNASSCCQAARSMPITLAYCSGVKAKPSQRRSPNCGLVPKTLSAPAAEPSMRPITHSSTRKFVWPGYGENMRVLEWMIGRIEGSATGIDNVFGTSPQFGDLRWDGLAFTPEQYASVIGIDRAAWQQELVLHAELFKTLEYHLPAELPATKARIEERLAAG